MQYEHGGEVYEIEYDPKNTLTLLKDHGEIFVTVGDCQPRSSTLADVIPLIWKEAGVPLDFWVFMGRKHFTTFPGDLDRIREAIETLREPLLDILEKDPELQWYADPEEAKWLQRSGCPTTVRGAAEKFLDQLLGVS